MNKETAVPIRSMVFAGSTSERVDAAIEAAPDAILFDLEAPFAPYPPDAQRRQHDLVQDYVNAKQDPIGKPYYFVRVSAPRTGETLSQLRGIVGPNLAGVKVSKVRGPADIHAIDGLLACMERDAGIPLGTIGVDPVVEHADAVRQAFEIATASDRIVSMGGGTSKQGDLHQSIGFTWTPEGIETLFLRSKVLVDVRSAGVRYPMSGAWAGSVDDVDGFRAWATSLRRLGYYGMTFHQPALVPIAHEVFSPSPADIEYWTAIDGLVRAAEGTGMPARYGDGREGDAGIIHPGHVESARMNLAWAELLGLNGAGGPPTPNDGSNDRSPRGSRKAST